MTGPIAALPMYDRPETAPANDALWAAIRARLGHGPACLTRADDLWPIWLSPDLLLAQTCGLPFRARLHDKVTLIGTPDYGLPGCPPGHYRSVFVARAEGGPATLDAAAGRRFAYNDALSQSGWAAPQAHMAALGLPFGALLKSGGHRGSALAVAEGRADFAALDAVTWALIQKHDGFATALQVIAETAPTPGLPLIAAPGTDPAPLFAAFAGAVQDLSAKDRATLHLEGLVAIPAQAYLAQPLPTAP
jgi:ABC-type phosphate/phosphonate transport system substrate-binding protein